MGIFKYSLHKPCWVKNLPNRCCRARRREASQHPAAGQKGRPAKARPRHQRWSKARTSFGESCIHRWEVNCKTLKPACSKKTRKNSSIIQHLGNGQRYKDALSAHLPSSLHHPSHHPPAIQCLIKLKPFGYWKVAAAFSLCFHPGPEWKPPA